MCSFLQFAVSDSRTAPHFLQRYIVTRLGPDVSGSDGVGGPGGTEGVARVGDANAGGSDKLSETNEVVWTGVGSSRLIKSRSMGGWSLKAFSGSFARVLGAIGNG